VNAETAPILIRWENLPAELDVSETTIRRWESRKLVRPFLIDGCKFVDVRDLEAVIDVAKARGRLRTVDYAREQREKGSAA
jgi:hypothetical protein